MYYEINVALNNRHFFATDPRSITTIHDLRKVLPVIAEKFPESEGYSIMVSEYPEMSTLLNTKELLNLYAKRKI